MTAGSRKPKRRVVDLRVRSLTQISESTAARHIGYKRPADTAPGRSARQWFVFLAPRLYVRTWAADGSLLPPRRTPFRNVIDPQTGSHV